MDDLRKSLDNIVGDLKARNLLIPAGVLLLLIVLAVFALPKSPAAVEPVTSAPANNDTVSERAAVASITLVNGETLDGHLVNTSAIDPFGPKGSGTKCYVGRVDGVKAVLCMSDGNAAVVACEGASCATGGAGGTGESGPVETAPEDDGNDDVADEEDYYVVDVTLNGKTYKNLEAGDGIPSSGIPTMFYAGASTSGKSAQFLVAEGLSVQGADFDPELGVFTAQEGDSVVLTAEDGTVNEFKLKDISKK